MAGKHIWIRLSTILALLAGSLAVAAAAPPPAGADGSEADNAPASQRLLTAGGNLTCAPTLAGVLKCFGNNGSGQLALGDAIARGDTPGEMGDSLPATALGTGRTTIELASGTNQTCFVLDNGGVKCWASTASANWARGTPPPSAISRARSATTSPPSVSGRGGRPSM